mgnify:CR=1 FL=1
MRTFYLGVGAQKAGTTWLFNQLRFHKKGFIFCTKEMHTFDVAFLNDTVSNKEFFTHPDVNIDETRKTLMDHPERYFNYFDNLMTDENPYSGDFTPDYANLTVEHFKYIKSEFERRDINLKIVYLMREPTTRLKSMMKMRRRNVGQFPPLRSLIEQKGRPGCDDNYSNYKRVVETIESVFDKKDIFYAFYELMFQQEDRIARFFEMDVNSIEVEKRYNESKKVEFFKFTKQEKKLLKSHYEKQYNFIKERFNFQWKIK